MVRHQVLVAEILSAVGIDCLLLVLGTCLSRFSDRLASCSERLLLYRRLVRRDILGFDVVFANPQCGTGKSGGRIDAESVVLLGTVCCNCLSGLDSIPFVHMCRGERWWLAYVLDDDVCVCDGQDVRTDEHVEDQIEMDRVGVDRVFRRGVFDGTSENVSRLSADGLDGLEPLQLAGRL